MSMQKMSFDLDKFPHLLNLKNTIEDMKRYIDLLNKRKVNVTFHILNRVTLTF